jgi:hypothetical protein
MLLVGKTMEKLFAVAGRFALQDKVVDVREFGNGNINNTYLVTLDKDREEHFILQQINTQVFRRPELVMQNMRIATEHICRRLEDTSLIAGRCWKIPRVLLTYDGRDYWVGPDGSFWRAISFIEDSQSFETIKDTYHAGEIGYALGVFHTLLSDLSPDKLADTLAGFHITPLYLRHYDKVSAKSHPDVSPEMNYCLKFVKERSAWAHVLEDAVAGGRLFLRTIHGDPKVNNILMDVAFGQAISIVDLDTVKPGLVHYDIGDCLRSACNTLGEETEEWEAVHFDAGLCYAVLKGYLSMAREFLTEYDIHYFYDSIQLLPFELGLRFFTDYLEGDVYFKVRRPEHNLARALVQFRLTESIKSQETAIRSIIQELR